MLNNYYNDTHPLRPYVFSSEATQGTLPPVHAIREKNRPAIMKGFWPCEKDGVFIQMEDYRERNATSGFSPEAYQEGTAYWLPGDVYGTPARKMTDIGPLPEGASLTAPEQTIEEARAAKLTEINAAFENAGQTGTITSSLGFDIDATERANRDTEGLITRMEARGEETAYFCDAQNVMRVVSLADVKTLRLEIIAYGQGLYTKKWTLRDVVNSAQSIEEVQRISWDTI